MRRWVVLSLGLGLLIWGVLPVQAQGGDGQTTIHVVQRGDTLYQIARSYGTSVEAIAQTNGLSDVTSIQAGQRLIIPSGAVNASVSTVGQHFVQPGETLAHIALRYGTTPEILAAINSIVNPAQLYVGQVLNVGQTAPGHPAITRGYTHTVQPGETLYRIALRYGVTLVSIRNANTLSLPNLIFPGQTLIIPGAETAPALQTLPAPLTGIEIYPMPAEVGRTISIRVSASQPVSISGTLMERPLQFAVGPDGVGMDALYGIHAFTIPGLYPLTLTVQEASGASETLTATLRIVDGRYNSEVITLPADQLALLDPALNTDEYQLIAEKMTGFSPTRHFDGLMGLPAAAPVTSPFGTRRSYNGGPYDRFHTGADFAGAPGSTIYAPAAGTVVFVGLLDIHGNMTILDHGWGIFTAYVHQAETYVEVGQFVNQGDALGTVGSTGRSTGPHLHWEMWVNGVEVDPLQWARVSFP